MNVLLSQLSVLVIFGVIVAGCLVILGYGPKHEPKITPIPPQSKPDTAKKSDTQTGKGRITQILGGITKTKIYQPKTRFYLEELDKNGDILQRFLLDDIPNSGLKVGVHPSCDFILYESEYISGYHCNINRNDAGDMFLEDHHSLNGTFVKEGSNQTKVDRVIITAGLECYLADRHIRFTKL